MAQYVSEHTAFIRQWLDAHPEEREQQKAGRALWWDKPQNLAQSESLRDASVPQKAYYYQTDV
jgi:hypothetical protein